MSASAVPLSARVAPCQPAVGNVFVLGFQGLTPPPWLVEFATRFGLGGVILFDKDLLQQGGERNIRNPNQLRSLCHDLHRLPSQPLVLVDQEGGRVRRLKEAQGFAPLPSAKRFATLPLAQQEELLQHSLGQMAELGIDLPLAPVIDLDLATENPDIGRLERSFSADVRVVRHCALLWAKYAAKHGVGLCLKHYPGIGAAQVSSHHTLMTLPALSRVQLDLFYALAPRLPLQSILISHAMVPEWAQGNLPAQPCTLSAFALEHLRQQLPNALFISDDLQMQGLLQHTQNLATACNQGLLAGLDCLLIGNNLKDDQMQASMLAEQLLHAMRSHPKLKQQVNRALARVAHAKTILGKISILPSQ